MLYVIYELSFYDFLDVECKMNLDCSEDLSCVNNKCIDLCKDSDICGKNAECKVKKYDPLCTCKSGYIGDPFYQCSMIASKIL